MPKTRPDHRELSAQSPDTGENLASAIAVGVADGTSTAPGAPPPHLLWATLESAYAPPAQNPATPREERLPVYIALPMAVGLSLMLWVIIIELVLMR